MAARLPPAPPRNSRDGSRWTHFSIFDDEALFVARPSRQRQKRISVPLELASDFSEVLGPCVEGCLRWVTGHASLGPCRSAWDSRRLPIRRIDSSRAELFALALRHALFEPLICSGRMSKHVHWHTRSQTSQGYGLASVTMSSFGRNNPYIMHLCSSPSGSTIAAASSDR